MVEEEPGKVEAGDAGRTEGKDGRQQQTQDVQVSQQVVGVDRVQEVGVYNLSVVGVVRWLAVREDASRGYKW